MIGFISLSLFLLSLAGSSLQCNPPGGDWRPLTVEELARRAPLVVKAYLVKGSADEDAADTFTRSIRCLHVTTIYKGALHPQDISYICPSKFGSQSLCLSDLYFGIPYIISLNKENNGYIARYDDIHSAAIPYSDETRFLDQLDRGVCCLAIQGTCRRKPLCYPDTCGVAICECGILN